MGAASIPWTALLLLGAAHGINPAMGWLFAVARGLQARDRRAVWRALGPLAVGHALAIGCAIGLTLAVGAVLPLAWLRWLVAASLFAVGVDGLVVPHGLGAWRGVDGAPPRARRRRARAGWDAPRSHGHAG
jgi:hypothetical protein